MMNFKMVCAEDGFTKTVSAASKEEAVKMLMTDPEVMEHLKTIHPDMATKTPEESMQMLDSMVSEEAAM